MDERGRVCGRVDERWERLERGQETWERVERGEERWKAAGKRHKGAAAPRAHARTIFPQFFDTQYLDISAANEAAIFAISPILLIHINSSIKRPLSPKYFRI